MEKQKKFSIIQRMYSIPSYITVYDAAEILDISVENVRKLCSEGKLEAKQTMPNSGKWRIETSQFMNYPGWNQFLEKRSIIKQQSLRLAEFMMKHLDEL